MVVRVLSVFMTCQSNFMTSQPAAIIPIMTYRCQNNLNLSLLFLWSAQASPMRRAPLACGDQGLESHCTRSVTGPTAMLTGSPPAPHTLSTMLGHQHQALGNGCRKRLLLIFYTRNVTLYSATARKRALTASLEREFVRNPCFAG